MKMEKEFGIKRKKNVNNKVNLASATSNQRNIRNIIKMSPLVFNRSTSFLPKIRNGKSPSFYDENMNQTLN